MVDDLWLMIYGDDLWLMVDG